MGNYQFFRLQKVYSYYRLYFKALRGNVMVTTSAFIIEKEFKVFDHLSLYIREFLLDGGTLFVGCFCVPVILFNIKNSLPSVSTC
jgi:hypothetical protein